MWSKASSGLQGARKFDRQSRLMALTLTVIVASVAGGVIAAQLLL